MKAAKASCGCVLANLASFVTSNTHCVTLEEQNDRRYSSSLQGTPEDGSSFRGDVDAGRAKQLVCCLQVLVPYDQQFFWWINVVAKLRTLCC